MPVPNIGHATLWHPKRTSFWRSSVTLLSGGHPSISQSLLHLADRGRGRGGAEGRLQTPFTHALLLKHSCPRNRFSHSGTTKYRHRWGLPSAPVLTGPGTLLQRFQVGAKPPYTTEEESGFWLDHVHSLTANHGSHSDPVIRANTFTFVFAITLTHSIEHPSFGHHAECVTGLTDLSSPSCLELCVRN